MAWENSSMLAQALSLTANTRQPSFVAWAPILRANWPWGSVMCSASPCENCESWAPSLVARWRETSSGRGWARTRWARARKAVSSGSVDALLGDAVVVMDLAKDTAASVKSSTEAFAAGSSYDCDSSSEVSASSCGLDSCVSESSS